MQDSLLIWPIYPADVLGCGHKTHPHVLRVMPTSLLTGAVHQTPGHSSAVLPFSVWPPHHATPGAPRGMVFSTEMTLMRCTQTSPYASFHTEMSQGRSPPPQPAKANSIQDHSLPALSPNHHGTPSHGWHQPFASPPDLTLPLCSPAPRTAGGLCTHTGSTLHKH